MTKNEMTHVSHRRIKEDKTLPKAVICDIDGTLAWMDRKPFDYTRVDKDRIDHRMVETIRALYDGGMEIIIMTSRQGSPECVRKTRRWLNNALGDLPYYLVIRKEDDYRNSAITKLELYKTQIEGKFDIVCVFEDSDEVVAMWRNNGFLCCQVAYDEFK